MYALTRWHQQVSGKDLIINKKQDSDFRAVAFSALARPINFLKVHHLLSTQYNPLETYNLLCFSFLQWIQDNADKLKPPVSCFYLSTLRFPFTRDFVNVSLSAQVNNFCIYDGQPLFYLENKISNQSALLTRTISA